MEPYPEFSEHEYAYSEVFGGRPYIQPYFRKTSKLHYEKSKSSLLETQCKQGLSSFEMWECINNFNNTFILYDFIKLGIGYSLSVYLFNKITNSITLYTSSTADIYYNNGSSPDISIMTYREHNHSKSYILQEIKNKLDEYEKFKNAYLFMDPLTTYEILLKRNICIELDTDYARRQTIYLHNNIINVLNQNLKMIPSLNIYLDTVGQIFEDGGRILFLNDNNIKPDNFEEVLKSYSKDTKENREYLINYIENQLENIEEFYKFH